MVLAFRELSQNVCLLELKNHPNVFNNINVCTVYIQHRMNANVCVIGRKRDSKKSVKRAIVRINETKRNGIATNEYVNFIKICICVLNCYGTLVYPVCLYVHRNTS